MNKKGMKRIASSILDSWTFSSAMKPIIAAIALCVICVQIVSSNNFDPDYEYSGHKERWAGELIRPPFIVN